MRLYNFGKHIGLTKLTDRELPKYTPRVFKYNDFNCLISKLIRNLDLSSYNTAIFGRLEGLRLLIFIHGQQINVHIVCVQKAIKIITEISTAHRSGQLKKVEHWLEVLPLQLSKLNNLIKTTQLLGNILVCLVMLNMIVFYVVDGMHRVCQVHLFNKKRDTINVKGLIDLNGAWGNFANLDEYEKYVALIANRRQPRLLRLQPIYQLYILCATHFLLSIASYCCSNRMHGLDYLSMEKTHLRDRIWMIIALILI